MSSADVTGVGSGLGTAPEHTVDAKKSRGAHSRCQVHPRGLAGKDGHRDSEPSPEPCVAMTRAQSRPSGPLGHWALAEHLSDSQTVCTSTPTTSVLELPSPKEPTTPNHSVGCIYDRWPHTAHDPAVQLLDLFPTERQTTSTKDTRKNAHGCTVGNSPLGEPPNVRLPQMDR